MSAYYNEIDPFAAQWLRNLIDAGHIAPGDVDTRSITEVQPDDIKHYTQVHFFAGIGGWSLALRLAGWPDDRPAWTGSCPCQPFSTAGKHKGIEDERHLWPAMFRLVRECRPAVVIGEQVSSAIGHGWIDGVCGDLEGEGYACGSAVLGAFSVGAPHKRSRLYWVANHPPAAADHAIGRTQRKGDGEAHRRDELGGRGDANALGDTYGGGRRPQGHASESTGGVDWTGADGAVEHPAGDRRDARRAEPDGRGIAGGRSTDAWSDFTVVPCLDGNARRVGRGVKPLAHGLPRDMGRGQPELFRLAKRARGNRVGRLKGYGNAIVPQVAAEFIRAYTECAQ